MSQNSKQPVAQRPTRGRPDLARLRRLTDRDIAQTAPADLPMLPDDFWREARVMAPVTKQAISLRVDADVLEWFRRTGPRYQSRMNAVLRSYVEQMRRPARAKRAG
ncbi:MAG: BrnA antitoxin family protein [Gemmatimonadaceae bacterium]